MVSQKKRKQQLKSPDEFQKKAFKFVDWCSVHQIKIAAVTSFVLSLAVGGLVWKFYTKKQAEIRLEKVGKIEEMYTREAENSFKEKTKLEKELAKIESVLNPSSSEKEAKKLSDKELADLTTNQSNLKKKIEELKPNHSASSTKYLEYFKQYADTKEGWRAGLNYLGHLVAEKNYDEATSFAKLLLSKIDSNVKFYQFHVRTLYVNLLEEQKNYANALEEMPLLIKNADDTNISFALLTKARLEYLNKNVTLAKQTLEEIISKHKSSPEAEKARALKYLW